MSKTEIISDQIRDGTIKKDDIDITTVGQSVITKIIAGTNIVIESSTGADSGTGVVTIGSSGAGGGISTWKNTARLATVVAGTLASSFENGDTVDGVTLVTGDRILIKNQATGSENGIYTVNVSGAPTRSTDANSSAKVLSGTAIFISEGTANSGTLWKLSTVDPIVLDTTTLTFIQHQGGGSGLANIKTSTVSHTTIDTTYTLTHNFNSLYVTGMILLDGDAPFNTIQMDTYFESSGLSYGYSVVDITLNTISFRVFRTPYVSVPFNITLVAVANGGAPKVTSTVSHTGSNAGTAYTVTHNFGASPVIVTVEYPTALVGQAQLPDNFSAGGTSYGWEANNLLTNSVDVMIFQWPRGSATDTRNAIISVYKA